MLTAANQWPIVIKFELETSLFKASGSHIPDRKELQEHKQTESFHVNNVSVINEYSENVPDFYIILIYMRAAKYVSSLDCTLKVIGLY